MMDYKKLTKIVDDAINLDDAYRQAYESQDVDKAMQLVREAAKQAMPNTKLVDASGYPKVMYHGSKSSFREFKRSKGRRWVCGIEFPVESQGFFFTDDPEKASEYGHNVVAAFLNATNICDLSDHDGKLYESLTGWNPWESADGGDAWWEILDNDLSDVAYELGQTEEGSKVVEKAKSLGYDSMAFAESSYGADGVKDVSFAMFDPEQIKSADPFTFDEEGNLIPLSERFDMSSSLFYK